MVETDQTTLSTLTGAFTLKYRQMYYAGVIHNVLYPSFICKWVGSITFRLSWVGSITSRLGWVSGCIGFEAKIDFIEQKTYDLVFLRVVSIWYGFFFFFFSNKKFNNILFSFLLIQVRDQVS